MDNNNNPYIWDNDIVDITNIQPSESEPTESNVDDIDFDDTYSDDTDSDNTDLDLEYDDTEDTSDDFDTDDDTDLSTEDSIQEDNNDYSDISDDDVIIVMEDGSYIVIPYTTFSILLQNENFNTNLDEGFKDINSFKTITESLLG